MRMRCSPSASRLRPRAANRPEKLRKGTREATVCILEATVCSSVPEKRELVSLHENGVARAMVAGGGRQG